MPDPLNWYVATICDDPAHVDLGTHPGRTLANGGCDGIIPEMHRVLAYDPTPTPTSCLVGSVDPLGVTGWVAKTLGEAQTHFDTVMGRAATAGEVY